MNVTCRVIEDLLPLYTEQMTSPDSQALVEEHLDTCAACQALYSRLKEPLASIDSNESLPLSSVKSRLQKERTTILWLGVFVVALLALRLFAWLNLPQYLPYREDLFELYQTNSGEIYASLDPSLTAVSTWETIDPDYGTRGLVIEAWTSRWDRLLGRHSQPHQIILSTPDKDYDFFEYANYSGDGQSPVYTLSPRGNTPRIGKAILPRLALNYYLSLAMMISGVSLVLWRILRKKSYAWLLRSIFFLSLSYLIGHLLIKGFGGASYHIVRDLIFIGLAGLLSFGVLSFGYRYLQLKDNI